MKAIAKIYTEFPEKFGIPRQSGLAPSLRGRVVFEPPYRNLDAVRGLEEFSHIWLIWEFSKSGETGALTVKPPRLGGKVKKGVFATRSPFRPNPIGLSSVRLEEIVQDDRLGPVLVVSGADLLDRTPIFDIKPYLPYTDAHPDARGSFGEEHQKDRLCVVFSPELQGMLPQELQNALCEVLAQDPRAAYQKKPDSVYGLAFAGYDVRFTVKDGTLTVREIVNLSKGGWNRIK